MVLNEIAADVKKEIKDQTRQAFLDLLLMLILFILSLRLLVDFWNIVIPQVACCFRVEPKTQYPKKMKK